MVAQSVVQIPKSTFTAKIEQAKIDIPDFTRVLMFQILRISVVLLGFGAIALAFSNLIASVLVIPFFFYLFRKYPFSGFDKQLAKNT